MTNKCFECDSTDSLEEHHVIPRPRGGTRTVFLCSSCHCKVHDIGGNRSDNLKALVKDGLDKARAKGVKLGRKVGSFISEENYLETHKDIVESLANGLSIRKAAKVTGKAISTVQRVKKKSKSN